MNKNPMNKNIIGTIVLLLLLLCLLGTVVPTSTLSASQILTFDRYHSPAEINAELYRMAKSNASCVVLHQLTASFGGTEMFILEIGPETGKVKKSLPAILVAANMEGITPIASEAALFLANELIAQPGERKDKTWYILPMGNPDASNHFFTKPLLQDSRNGKPHNDDMDDNINEDGMEDLDGNGIITVMRVKDPTGQWIPVEGEPRLMKKADPIKGEKGIYNLYTEGIDNDHDGQYNEDGPGGVNTGLNFPQMFQFFTVNNGTWPGSEEETFSFLKFVYDHPEIALSMTFGNTNFCMVPPKSGRKSAADFDKIKIPEALGKRFNFDTGRTYTMKEVIAKMSPLMPPTIELTEGMVAGFLGLGQAVNPLPEDLKFYTAITEEFKKFLKKNKMDTPRLESQAAKDGSFELWSYYQLGLHTYSMDFWTLPQLKKEKGDDSLSPEKIETMSNEDFIALGEEKITAFLKSSGAPSNINAKSVIDMLKGGKMTTKKIAEMMKQMPKPKSTEGANPAQKAQLAFSDNQLGGEGFIPWKSFQHPTLGTVEIGGFVPFSDNTPRPSMLPYLLKGQVPWVFELVKKLPHLRLVKTEVEPLGGGIYRVKAWVENSGFLPYPTAMGKRNKRYTPVVVSLKGKNYKILEGKKRSLIKSLPGYSTEEVEWMVLAEQPVTLELTAFTPNAWSDSRSISLK